MLTGGAPQRPTAIEHRLRQRRQHCDGPVTLLVWNSVLCRWRYTHQVRVMTQASRRTASTTGVAIVAAQIKATLAAGELTKEDDFNSRQRSQPCCNR